MGPGAQQGDELRVVHGGAWACSTGTQQHCSDHEQERKDAGPMPTGLSAILNNSTENVKHFIINVLLKKEKKMKDESLLFFCMWWWWWWRLEGIILIVTANSSFIIRMSFA